jgi:hypothetical protein
LLKNRLLALLEGALDYLPVILTVLFAAVVSLIAGSSETPTDELLQWTLAVLALMATTQLIDRFRVLRSVDERLERLEHRSRASMSAGDFFMHQRPDLQERLRHARSIAISGVTLARTSVSLWAILRERLEHHVPVRIMALDPDHPASEIATYRMQRLRNPARIQSEVKHSLENFASLCEHRPELRETLELRVLPYAIPYGIWVIDSGTTKAELWVEIYSFRDALEPTFHLQPHRDGEWFTLFEGQFEKMWEVSRVWTPEDDSETSR